jgi:hypothetical protein
MAPINGVLKINVKIKVNTFEQPDLIFGRSSDKIS